MNESSSAFTPEFEIFTTLHTDGRPNIVSVRAIRRGFTDFNEQNIFSSIASNLQSAVIDAVKTSLVSISDTSLGYINGILQMNNISDYRKAHTADVDLCDLNIRQIQTLFEKVAEYGEIGVFDVEFCFGLTQYL
jgi:hypothetical protein